MAGRFGGNCDNHQYYRSLKNRLIQSWQYLTQQQSCYLSDWILGPNTKQDHQRIYMKVPSPERTVQYSFSAHEVDSPVEELLQFYKTIRESVKPKIFVGPSRLKPNSFLNIQHEVTTPLLEAYLRYDAVCENCVRVASNVEAPIFLLACGFISCLLAEDIHRVNPQATVIDLGSSLDPLLVGPTRKTHLSQQSARDLYKEWNVAWPQQQHYYQEIPGWFNFEHLYSLVVSHFPREAKFVEVGTWKGKSAAYLCTEMVKAGKQQTLDCVDHFKGSKEEQDTHHKEATSKYIAEVCGNNLRPFWLSEKNKHWSVRRDNLVKLVPLSSIAAAKQYKDNSLDFVFIDAGHSYEEVRQDIKTWLPKVKQGGWLAGHDYNAPSFPGVSKAVNELLPNVIDMTSCWVYKNE